MDKEELCNIINKNLKEFTEELGFKLRCETEGVWYEKEENNFIFRVGIGVRAIYINEISLKGCGAAIVVHTIEDIIESVTQTEKIPRHLNTTFIKGNLNHLQLKDFSGQDTLKVRTEEDVLPYCKYIEEYFKTSALPFFQKYSQIQALNEIVETTPQMELYRYIPKEVPFKKMIIMKMAGSKKYQEYIDWLDNGYAEHNMTNTSKYKTFQKLRTYLDSEDFKKKIQ